jgi:metal-responsive CopG/Arc/MetJ family transcriptional regulator
MSEQTDKLIAEARRIGHHKTKSETIRAALQEYIERRKQLEIVDLFGTIEYDADYDYKAERARKSA